MLEWYTGPSSNAAVFKDGCIDALDKDLAAQAGISPTTLAKMKKDGATVSSDVLVKICTALNCTMDDIVEIIPSNTHGEE